MRTPTKPYLTKKSTTFIVVWSHLSKSLILLLTILGITFTANAQTYIYSNMSGSYSGSGTNSVSGTGTWANPTVLPGFNYTITTTSDRITAVINTLEGGTSEVDAANVWESKYGQIDATNTNCIKVRSAPNGSCLGCPLLPAITTVITFNTTAQPGGWGFLLADIDVDQTRIRAKDPNGVYYSNAEVSSWFKGAFDMSTLGNTSIPCWDATNATLVGGSTSSCVRLTTLDNYLEDQNASAYFEPDVPVSTIEFGFDNLQYSVGIPSQRYFIAAATTHTVSGYVFNDPNGGNVNNSTGTTNLVPAGMFANLIDASGNVVGTTTVVLDGYYSFSAAGGSYTVVISTTQGVYGSPAPVSALLSGWVHTGDYNGPPNTGNTNTTFGTSSSFTVGTIDVSNINFGIQPVPPPTIPCATTELIADTRFIFTNGSNATVNANTLNFNGWVGSGSGVVDIGPNDTYIYDNVNTQTFTHAFTDVNKLGSGAVITMSLGMRNGIVNPGGGAIVDWGEATVLSIIYGGVTYATVTTDPTTGSDGHIATINYFNGASGSLPNGYTIDYGTSPQGWGIMNLTDWHVFLPGSVPNNSNLVIEFNPGGTSAGDAADDFTIGAVSLKACQISIKGNILNDIDGLTDGIVDNNGGAQAASTLPAGLTANLFNATTGAFVASVTLQPDGTYTFPNVNPNTNYTVIISNVAATVTSTTTNFPSTLPTGWANTGDVNPTDPTATALTPGISSVIEVATSNTINVNFGIERLPESAFNLQPSTGNPGGFNNLTVPTGAFQTNNVGATPNTQDYDGGTVTNIRITEFPTGANSITIGTTTYTNGGTCPPATTCTPWPAAGVRVPYTNGTGPSVPIKVDPVEGNIDVVIKFVSIDNAGKEDPTPGSVTIPFRTISVTGTVWDDTNGDLTQNGTEAVINGTNTGGGVLPGQVLYANLIDANGIVIATVPVQSNGTYNFSNVPQSATGLTVQLSTNQGTVGLAKPTTTPPAGWVTIGENKNGQGGVADAAANGEISLTTGTVSITQQNFAIERVPNSDPKTQFVPYPTGGIIPAGKATTDVTGSDPEEGTYTSGTNHSIVITTLPTNAIMLYNGSPVLVNQVITGFNPLFLSFTNITNGSTQVEFQYAFKDLAQQQDPTPAKYVLTWAHTAPLPITLESFTAKAPTCDKIDFDWKISNAINFNHFEIEKSGNGIAFHSIAVILYNPAVTNYHFSETNGSKGQYQYRLKMVDEDGTVKYSSVVFVRLDCNQQQIMLFPNPVKNNLIITGLNKNEKISLYAISGSLLYSKVATNYQEQIEMTRLSSGVYKVIISNSEGTIINSSTIIKADQ